MAWACIVVVVVIDHSIVDHSGAVDDLDFGAVMCVGCIEVEDISMVDPAIRDK
jgi:hypothetical protein